MEPPIQVQEQGPPPQAVSHVCAAGEHCCMKTIPVQGLHSCLNCDKKMHGILCGTLWEERGSDCRIGVDDLTESGRNKAPLVGALICFACSRGV